jgi:hypothetical protein
MCGGDSSRQCCGASGGGGSGECNLVRYSNTYIKAGLGNLSTKNRLRERFSGTKSRQVS